MQDKAGLLGQTFLSVSYLTTVMILVNIQHTRTHIYRKWLCMGIIFVKQGNGYFMWYWKIKGIQLKAYYEYL